MLTSGIVSGPWLEGDPDAFQRRFDREAFVFRHRLADHPLFAPERLLRLAQQMAQNPHDVFYDAGDIRVDQRWDETAVCDLPIDVLLHRIETVGAWVILRRAEKDPEYASLLEACMAEIETLSGIDLAKLAKLRNAIVFITSPGRVSSYHIDRECNCLLQIRGRKTISVFDRNDRRILAEEDLERFWTVDNNAPSYNAQLQHHAAVFELAPGDAVHIPVNAPHWVKNGTDVSVSLSINFHYRDAILADVYRANYWLRRIGLHPMPPRRSPIVDGMKSLLYGSARSVKAATRHVRRKA